MKRINLNDKETEILDSYEHDEWKTVENPKREFEKLRKCAANTLRKTNVSKTVDENNRGS